MADEVIEFEPVLYTSHPTAKFRLPHGRFISERSIFTLNSPEELVQFEKDLGELGAFGEKKIRKVTPALLVALLGHVNQMPMATQGTDSDTAKLAQRALEGQIAAQQIAGREQQATAAAKAAEVKAANPEGVKPSSPRMPADELVTEESLVKAPKFAPGN